MGGAGAQRQDAVMQSAQSADEIGVDRQRYEFSQALCLGRNGVEPCLTGECGNSAQMVNEKCRITLLQIDDHQV